MSEFLVAANFQLLMFPTYDIIRILDNKYNFMELT